MIDDKTAAAELLFKALLAAIAEQEPAEQERLLTALKAGRRAFRKVADHRYVILIDGVPLLTFDTPIAFIPWPDALPEDRTN